MTAVIAQPGVPRRGVEPALDATDVAMERSGVSWSAILAGAAGAAALSLILLMLGAGLGLSSVSPWAGLGASATALGVSAILWLSFTQLAASGMGGYLAGRLRTKWPGVHGDEVYFRDTAHGFLAWAVATLATAALLTSTLGSIVGAGVDAGAAVVAGTAQAATTGAAAAGANAANSSSAGGSGNVLGYFVDSLFRTAPSAPGAGTAPASTERSRNGGAASVEAGRIFASAIRSGTLPAEDARYVGQLVAEHTGMSQADAQRRVTDVFGKLQTQVKDAETAARDAADKARKASAYATLWIFVSLLIGAFVASLAATYGGRRRDL